MRERESWVKFVMEADNSRADMEEQVSRILSDLSQDDVIRVVLAVMQARKAMDIYKV